MTWLLFEFKPSTLFALKSSYATSTVARSLVVPTPYVIKMAFLNAAFHSEKNEIFCRNFVDRLSSVQIRIKPSSESVVTQTIQNVRVPLRENSTDKVKTNSETSDKVMEYQSTVAYREVVWLKDSWIWALNVGDDVKLADDLLELAPYINYVGKRGSFVQFIRAHGPEQNLGTGFSIPVEEATTAPLQYGSHIAPLDDFGPEMTFDAANSYNKESKIRLGKHRKIVSTFVPCKITNSGYGFRRYSR